ncbi:MAG: hypothetical protein CMN78_02630 [Spirochaetales bacterium]|nr:hypothetical protein [Spirochaetales bacterium]
MPEETNIELALRCQLEQFAHISFAFLFGSAASGRLNRDSDVDVAIYGDSGANIEVESDRVLDDEISIQIALERVTGRNVDLLVLNRAPATVCTSALLTGCKLLIRSKALYTRYFLAVTNVAIDFLQTEREFREIRQRSSSLSELDRSRLERILDSVSEELTDRSIFINLSLDAYRTDRSLRRNVDRWVETLINAAVNVAKIILSSEGRAVPQTYAQILAELESMPSFTSLSGCLVPLAGLRNLLVHEYLDIRYGKIRSFIDTDADAIAALNDAAADWLGM